MGGVMEVVRCDAVWCEAVGVEFLHGTLPAVNGADLALVRIRLWLCADHVQLLLDHGMKRPGVPRA